MLKLVMALVSANPTSYAELLVDLPELLRDAIYANFTDECRPDDCNTCIRTWFCDENTAWPVTADCTTAGIVVTAQDLKRRVQGANCTATYSQTFHVRFFAACWPTEPDGCVDDIVKELQRCLFPFLCALQTVKSEQLGIRTSCGPMELADKIECFNEGGCAGWETYITVPF
jgi:hypothetical protein